MEFEVKIANLIMKEWVENFFSFTFVYTYNAIHRYLSLLPTLLLFYKQKVKYMSTSCRIDPGDVLSLMYCTCNNTYNST